MKTNLLICVIGLIVCVFCIEPAEAQWITTNIAYAKRDVSPLDYYPDDTTTYYEVRGRVTSPHYTTNGSEFYIQDTNDNVGIRVDSTTIRPELTLYAEVNVIGLISQTAGVRRISPQFSGDLTVTDPNPVTVQPVAGTIASLLANAERYEGTYVVISNVYAITNATMFPWSASASISVSDSTARITLRVDVDTDIDGQLAPTNPFTLYGIFSQFDTSATPTGRYQVLPRFYADIVQSATPQPPQIYVVNSNRFSVIVNNSLNVTLIAQDRNPEDALVLTLDSPPAGAAVQWQTNRVWQLSWTPDLSYENTTNFITVQVADGALTNAIVLEVVVLSETLGNIKLNEIHWDPASGEAGDANGDGITHPTQDEFVEIVNANTSSMDITGWKLFMGTNVLFTFPPTVLTGRTAAVVFGGGTPAGVFGHAIVYAAPTNWTGLVNSPGGNAVRLVTDSGAEVSAYNYAAFGTPDMAITRNPDFTGDFVLHTSVVSFVRWTPGTKANGAYFEGSGQTNAPPLLARTADRSVLVGRSISISFQAYDPEGNPIAFSISNTPLSATFTDYGDGTALLTYTGLWSDLNQAFEITVSADDGIAPATLDTFTLRVTDPLYGGLVFNEICFNPSTTFDSNEDGTNNSSADEYVEIVNTSTGALDLAGCMIYDSTTNVRHRFTSLVVPSGGCVVVFGGGALTNFWRSPAQVASSTQLGLNNDPPEFVILYDPQTNEIARFELQETPPIGASLTRYPDLADIWVSHFDATTNTVRGSPGRRVDGSSFYTNVAPLFAPLSPVSVAESNSVNVTVLARAYDSDTITLTASNLPPGATFTNTPSAGLTTGLFAWASATPAGVYTSKFYAADKDGITQTTLVITISGAVTSTPVVWINEIHYDNTGTDAGEGIEIAGTAGTDLSEYTLYLYNGVGGTVYSTNPCSGVIDDEGCGYGAMWFAIVGIQNGGSDGVALVYNSDTSVVQFLSYEGTLIASAGPAAGLLSVNIGVSEGGSDPAGYSLQLQGTGTSYGEFTWTPPTNATPGTLNAAQFIAGCGTGDQDGDGMPDDWETIHFGCATCAVANADSDNDGFSNLEEYLADTIPSGPAGSNSFFTIENVTNAAARYIEFVSSTGRLYTLQGTANPVDGQSWSNLGAEVQGSGGSMSLSDTNQASWQLYRVRVRAP